MPRQALRRKLEARQGRTLFREDLLISGKDAASSGHRDDPVPERREGRSAAAQTRRAAAKATGTMSISKKIDGDTRVAGVRGERAEPVRKAEGATRKASSRAARGQEQGSDKQGSDQVAKTDAPVKVRRSNAEIAEQNLSTARRAPAPRAARTNSASETSTAPGRGGPAKTTGGARQRAPAPGNVVTVTKRAAIAGGAPKSGTRATSSEGTAKPVKKSARGGRPTGASKSKGADQGLSE